MAAKKIIFSILTLLTFLFTAYIGYYIYLKLPAEQGQRFIPNVGTTEPAPPSEQPISYTSVDELILSVDTGKKFKSVKGQLVLGGEIDRSYCGAGIYIKDSTGELLLRQFNANGDTELFNKKEFLGKNVEIQGIYPEATNFCMALICDCENYFLLQKVSSLEFGL